MLNNTITRATSFSKDKTYDFSGIYGYLFHNEAIAFPINMHEVGYLRNPQNNNPRFIAKFQYGFGILRPKLVYQIVKGAVPKVPGLLITEKKNS